MDKQETQEKREKQEMQYLVSGYQKDPEALHLYVNDVRILTPHDYEILRSAIPKDQHKTLFDVLLITGMRYIEVCRLYTHQQWYNPKRNLIHLPKEAQKKKKRKQLERNIHPLPSMFSYILKDFFEGKKPPLETCWNKDLQRWAKKAGLAPYGISAKTTRKTIESWSVAAGLIESAVCLRQGHDSLTSMRHYQSLAFSDDELRDIKKKLTDWGMMK